MGYFSKKFGIRLFNEAEADGQDLNNPEDQPTDYTEDIPRPQSQETDEQPNAEMRDNEQNMQQSEEQPPVDYTEEDSQRDTDREDQPNNKQAPQENPDEQPVDDLKMREEELYNNLTPEQLDIKHKELKNQFLALYDITTSIIDRIGDAAVSEENIGVAEYISNELSKMRNMLTDYMESVYKGKSYIENSINYNRFLAVLNGINKILEQLDKKENN